VSEGPNTQVQKKEHGLLISDTIAVKTDLINKFVVEDRVVTRMRSCWNKSSQNQTVSDKLERASSASKKTSIGNSDLLFPHKDLKPF
jgi:hypothetical protein